MSERFPSGGWGKGEMYSCVRLDSRGCHGDWGGGERERGRLALTPSQTLLCKKCDALWRLHTHTHSYTHTTQHNTTQHKIGPLTEHKMTHTRPTQMSQVQPSKQLNEPRDSLHPAGQALCVGSTVPLDTRPPRYI